MNRYEARVDATSVTCCPSCGAPVGSDGRYEHPVAGTSVTPGTNRYEGRPESRSVTLADRIRLMKPMMGSPRWWRDRTGHETGCVICGAELPANLRRWTYLPGGGERTVARHRMYCSNACRQKAYRERKKLEELDG